MTSLLKLFSFLFLIGLILNFPLMAMENDGSEQHTVGRPYKKFTSDSDSVEINSNDSSNFSALQKFTEFFLTFPFEQQLDIVQNWRAEYELCKAKSPVHAHVAKLFEDNKNLTCAQRCYDDGISQHRALHLVSRKDKEELKPELFKQILDKLKSEDAHSILHLGIAFFKLNDECLTELIGALQTLPHIQGVGLHKCSLSSKGIIDLAHFLKTNSTIIALEISDNRISKQDAATFGEIFDQNQTLQFLDLSDTGIDEEAHLYFQKCIKNNNDKNKQIYENYENYVKTLGTQLYYY